mgnify:FL=1|jgi:hypothetical protein
MAIDKIESAGLATSTNQPNFRNIIINGDMSIAQRGTSSTSNGYCLDRFTMDESTDGAVTVSQDTTVPSGQGFAKSLKVDVTTADSSIAAAQYCGFTQFIEGQNLQYLKYGTSSAESLTLSFWVRSTKTGTYCVRFVKEAGSGTRYECPIEYTISSSDTWEKKTITLSPTAGSTSLITATAGAIVNSNASGFRVFWTLAAGTDYHGTNNTWTSTSDRLSTSNQVNFLDNTSNNFYITGVQFEVGTSASDFEFLPTDVNLQRCYRYFQLINTGGVGKIIGTGGSYDNNTVLLSYTWVPKRTTPSLYQVSGTGYFYFYGSGSENDAFDLWKIYSPNYLHGLLYSDDSSISLSDNVVGWFQLNNSAAVLGLQAEL